MTVLNVHHSHSLWKETVLEAACFGVLCSAYQRREVGTGCAQFLMRQMWHHLRGKNRLLNCIRVIAKKHRHNK